MSRLSTGVPGLDAKLGGGLVAGTMTVVVGSSGIGKTQLGIQFARAGLAREKATGVIFDMATRIDPQGHLEYAKRIANWTITPEESEQTLDYAAIFNKKRPLGDYLRALTTKGRRVTRRDVDFDTWNDWHADLAKHLDTTIAFFYSHFIRGCKRVVIDGIEPVTRQGESIQFELLEYVYHQILRKESDWLARDLFRQFYRANERNVAKNGYDLNKIGCVVLYTSPETSLDAMVEKPMDEGDLLAGANTIIYLGKVREGTKFRRAMYISKHRSSNCSDEIMLYEIDEKGLRIL